MIGIDLIQDPYSELQWNRQNFNEDSQDAESSGMTDHKMPNG